MLGRLEPGLHQRVDAGRRVEVALRDREPALRGTERGASPGQPPGGAGEGLAGLLEVALGSTDLTLHVPLPVAELVVRHRLRRDGADPDQQGRACGSELEPGRKRSASGEGADHEISRSSGEEVNAATVTREPHTLRYLRVITSVGIKVSRIPSTAMPPIAR